MHCATLLFLENETIEDMTRWRVEEVLDEFDANFSNRLGEQKPAICLLADWFCIGGRWSGELKARRGIAPSAALDQFYDEDEELIDNETNGCEVDDLLEPFHPMTYVINNEKVIRYGYDADYYGENGDYEAFTKAIDEKKVHGVLLLIDCHS